MNDPYDELAKLGPALGRAIDRFNRQVVKEASRKPKRHPPANPGRLPSRRAPTVLDRRRALDARRGGRLPFATSVERGAARVAGAIRNRVLALRQGLGRLRGRLGRSRR